MSEKKILINCFHPDLSASRGNKALLDAVRDLPNVTVRDLHAQYPDGVIDGEKERQLLVEHDVIVLQHPIFWFSCPPLFKAWQDVVLTMGFAFPPGEGTALEGKIWQSVVTTGSPAQIYSKEGPLKADFEEILTPLRLTATHCSMAWQAPFTVSSVIPEDAPWAQPITAENLQRRADEYRELLASF